MCVCEPANRLPMDWHTPMRCRCWVLATGLIAALLFMTGTSATYLNRGEWTLSSDSNDESYKKESKVSLLSLLPALGLGPRDKNRPLAKPALTRRLAPPARGRRRRDREPTTFESESEGGDSSSDPDRDVPRNAMGFLCQNNPLVEELGTRCKTISKNIGGLGCDRKIIDLAAEKGRNIDAIPLAFRQARVADACPESCGLCETCAPGCARWFIRNGFCEPECNNADCQFDGGDCWDIDCAVTEWSDWSECSVTCDRGGSVGVGGIETRNREIIVAKTLNGKPCPELTESRQGCNQGVPCPVPCQLSGWGDWSECSATCGPGQSSRKRAIIKPPENGAAECPELEQVRDCLVAECDRECIVSEWSDWGDCSSSCGAGAQIRKRRIQVVPIGPKECPPLVEEQPCVGINCGILIRETCKLSPWSDWTPCSVECGGGIETRKRAYVLSNAQRLLTLSEAGMASCPPVEIRQEQPCNEFECLRDCKMSEWSEFSSCNATCGFGVSARTRSVEIINAGHGLPCPDGLKQEKECYAGPCDIDCKVSEWSPWSDCASLSGCGFGLRAREREVIDYPTGHGAKCPVLKESQECIIPCELSCQLGQYTEWTDCANECQVVGKIETGNYFSYRWQAPSLVAPDCPDIKSLVQARSCGSEFKCLESTPNDCLVSDWSNWSECSASCGGGSRSRNRKMIKEQQDGGHPCPHLVEAENCATSPCPIDCRTSDWGAWSACSSDCGLGGMTRARTIVVQPSSNGSPCGALEETSPCVGDKGGCAQDCAVSEWESWSSCSSPCGSLGSMRRSRRVVTMPIGEGRSCPDLIEWKDCDLGPCDLGCVLSEWSAWSKCTVDCGTPGTGTQRRNRQIIVHPLPGSDKVCPKELEETRPCVNLQPCSVDCELTEWTDWSSDCPAACGIGERVRTREVITQPLGGGKPCGELKDASECFRTPCVVDCEVGEWGDWTLCSAECNGGTRFRRKDIIRAPMNNGTACPMLVEYEDCNVFVCPEDLGVNPNDCQVSEWSEWSTCPVTCGGSLHHRTRSIVSPSKPGGIPCPDLVQTKGCGLSRCKGKPCEDNVAELAKNGVTCAILKAKGCEANIYELSVQQGISYPEGMPKEARVKDACPETCLVCSECAPDCQLRDKGNTICDAACNNQACEFDLGDCGGDCKIPSPVPSTLEILPAATGLEVGQSVKITCSKSSERFKAAPELSEASLVCAEPKASWSVAQTAFLEVHPISVWMNRVTYPIVELTSLFQCVPDPCPSVGVTGFQDAASVLNGVYDRAASPSGRSRYLQNFKSPSLRRRGGEDPFHLWMDAEGSASPLSSPAFPQQQQSSVFLWRITPFDPSNQQPDAASIMAASTVSQSNPGCRMPAAGQSSSFEQCLGISSDWAIGPADASRLDQIVQGIHVRCVDKKDRRDLLKYVPSGNEERKNDHDDNLQSIHQNQEGSVGRNEIDMNGRPMTFLVLEGGERKQLFCEDQPEVPEIADRSCTDIVDALGCDFLLADTGKKIPDYLPAGTTVGQICPMTCELCSESCAAGCPDWFLRNRYCDAACNNEACGFDHGDCENQDHQPSGIPFTFLLLPTGEQRKVFCEDQPEVPEISGMNCTDIVDALGCDFLLADTGKKIPDYLPAGTTVGQICPMTCELCVDECSPGCPTWFLKNLFCDFSCNTSACEYDQGDCDASSSTPAMGSTPTAATVGGGFTVGEGSTVGRGSVVGGGSTVGEEDARTDSSGLRLPPQPPLTTTMEKGNVEDVNPSERIEDDGCIDDPMIIELGYTCKTLKAVATNKLNGCEAKLLDVAKVQQPDKALVLPVGVPPITRVMDACPVTCDCCDCVRLRKPILGQTERKQQKIVVTLQDGEFPNCIDDIRVLEASGMSCPQIVYAVSGRCELALAELSSSALPENISANMTLSEACGYSCGKCPICEDQPLVEETGGYTCQHVVEMLDGNCDILLKDLGDLPENVPKLATLKHACPMSCGMCTDGLPLPPPCQDHPQIEAIGYTCELLLSFATQHCSTKLSEMGIDSSTLPLDLLGPTSTIADACPSSCKTCSAVGRRCQDNPILGSMSQSCTTLIQVGVLGCQTRLHEIGSDLLPPGVPSSFRVKDVCEESCGLCGIPSCLDGFQNGDEEGIDCGGSCRPCRPCRPGSLKALGLQYQVLQGSGLVHMSNRTIGCSTGYEKMGGQFAEETIYCLDGWFTKLGLHCGEPRIELLKGTVRLMNGQYLDHTALPPLYESLRSSLILPVPIELRISAAGNCGEMDGLGTFLCEDNAEVAKMGFDCSLLARLGCHLVLSALASQQGVGLPAGIPKEATIADACPITCNTCDFLKKRMHELEAAGNDKQVEDQDRDATECLRLNFFIRTSSEHALFLQEYFSGFDPAGAQSKLIATLEGLLRVQAVDVRYVVGSEVMVVDASEYFEKTPLGARYGKIELSAISISEWDTAFGGVTAEGKHQDALARSVFIAPGLPAPTFDSSSIPRHIRAEDIVGRMYRPIAPLPANDHLSFSHGLGPQKLERLSPSSGGELKGGRITGWFDSSASASVVAPLAGSVLGECYETAQKENCCDAMRWMDRFLSGPCGRLIYNRVVSEHDMQVFCFSRNQVVKSTRAGRGEEDDKISCYEEALRMVDTLRDRGGGKACSLVPYMQVVVQVWCSKDGIESLVDAESSYRRDVHRPFCFPTLKSTLQQRFDLYYVASLSDFEMDSMCSLQSCMRHHLRYVDALTQLQVGWSLSGAHVYRPKTLVNVSTEQQEGLNEETRSNDSSNRNTRTSQTNDSTARHDDPNHPTTSTTSALTPTDTNSTSKFFPPRLLREASRPSPLAFDVLHQHVEASIRLTESLSSHVCDAAPHCIINPEDPSTPRRQLESVSQVADSIGEQLPTSSTFSSSSFGLYIGDFPEQFLDFVCTKVHDSYCQQTLLLLTDEDTVHNPTLLKTPCETHCFIPMIGKLGGLVRSYGDRQGHPYFKALGSILRSYGRFYCTKNSENKYCGDYLFKKMKAPKLVLGSLSNFEVGSFPECQCATSFLNDGQCDLACFNEACGWDGDDCRVPIMFSEVYYALIDIFAEQAHNQSSSTAITPLTNRLSMHANTSCLFYDPAFSCTPKCRRLYEAGNNLQGCCFSGALDALGSLLKVEAEHPIVNNNDTKRWEVDRSLVYLEQACAASFDRTCSGKGLRGVLKFDVLLDSVSLAAFGGNATGVLQSVYSDVTSAHQSTPIVRQLVELIRKSVTESLVIVEADIPRVILRPHDQNSIAVEIVIDAGQDEANRLKEIITDADSSKALSNFLQRRLQSLSLNAYHQDPLFPFTTVDGSVSIPSSSLKLRSVYTPPATFDVKASLPPLGTLGWGWDNGADDSIALPTESCDAEDLWKVGSGYRVIADTSSGSSVLHNATRTLKCSAGYTRIDGHEPDQLLCDNGRWLKQHGLSCQRHCTSDVWTALHLNTGTRSVVETASVEAPSSIAGAYIVGGDTTRLQHGATRKISCGKGFTAGRSRTPTTTTCVDGSWTSITLECKRQCQQYDPPDPSAFIVTGEIGDLDHGAVRSVHCARGYFSSPALNDASDVYTECNDGHWTILPINCIKPEAVDPNAGPGMFVKMLRQLFTGPGMIGILSAILATIVAVVTVAVAWRMHFKHQATQNTINHETRMDYVAKLAARTIQETAGTTTLDDVPHNSTSHPSEKSTETMESELHNNNNNNNNSNNNNYYNNRQEEEEEESCSAGERGLQQRRRRMRMVDEEEEEEYFGDVELTPVSSSTTTKHPLEHPRTTTKLHPYNRMMAPRETEGRSLVGRTGSNSNTTTD